MAKNEDREALARIARELRGRGTSLRQIARSLGIHRNTVKRLLADTKEGRSEKRTQPQAADSKLDPYKKRIEYLITKKDLTNRKILEILREEGYTGGKTILGDCLRKLRGTRASRKAFARYEPAPGYEAQCDWATRKVTIDGKKTTIQIFSIILSYSRYQYLQAFLDQKQDTLFEGHIEAFDYFQGIPAAVLYDNQTPVVAGRISGRTVLFHSRFLTFAEHYGFTAKVCLPYDKERKGRVERPFRYLDTSFFPWRVFRSLEDLRMQLHFWLEDGTQKTGNFRTHGTTRRRPVDMWQEEKDLLITLPEVPFIPTRIEQRLVGKDCLISVMGNFFTVPPAYVGRTVTVMISPRGIRVFNGKREVIASHDIPAGKGKMVIDEDHYAQIKRTKNYLPASDLEGMFVATFPKQRVFLDEMKRHLKGICPIHLQHIRKLLEHFTVEQVGTALEEAASCGIFSSTYVEEVLNRRWPSQIGLRRFDERLSKPKGLQLGQVDPGDSDGYGTIFGEVEDNEELGKEE